MLRYCHLSMDRTLKPWLSGMNMDTPLTDWSGQARCGRKGAGGWETSPLSRSDKEPLRRSSSLWASPCRPDHGHQMGRGGIQRRGKLQHQSAGDTPSRM